MRRSTRKLARWVGSTGVGSRLLSWIEQIAWGGPIRGRIFEWLVLRHYESRFRRDWLWTRPYQLPHFYDQRISALHSILGDDDPLCLLRGVFAAQIIREGDVVLDIGCGDGFYSRQFFAKRCASVDAVDVDANSIAHSNTARPVRGNLTFHLGDVTSEPFPRGAYDVVVWDGALGHFSRQDSEAVLRKVAGVLDSDGVFVGSESLGWEGNDHLQSFQSLDDLERILLMHFDTVELSEQTYRTHAGRVRQEAYWRCGFNSARLRESGWKTVGT